MKKWFGFIFDSIMTKYDKKKKTYYKIYKKLKYKIAEFKIENAFLSVETSKGILKIQAVQYLKWE
jgi:hypothetical protein